MVNEDRLMKRTLIWINVVGVMLLSAALAWGQDIAIKGDTSTIKVKRVVTVEEDRVLIKSAPFDLEGPAGGILYRWRFPAGFEAAELGRVLRVTKAPKGDATVTVQYAVIKIDFVKQTTDISEKGASTSFIVGEPGPAPPIPPDPKPDPPDPKPDPPPFPSAGLAAMIVYETSEVTPSLSDVMSGMKTNDMMWVRGIKGGFLKIDKDADVSGLEPWARAAFVAAKGKPLPVIVISNGKTGYAGELPKLNGVYSPDKTVELLRKYVIE